jgi:hypothetical protein
MEDFRDGRDSPRRGPAVARARGGVSREAKAPSPLPRAAASPPSRPLLPPPRPMQREGKVAAAG